MTEPAKDSERCLSPLQLTVWSSVAGLIMLTPVMMAETWMVGLPSPSANAWIAMVFLAVFSTVIAYVWFADGILTIGAGKSALYVYLVPIFGILSGYLLLDEKLGASLVLAFILIVGGVMLAQSKQPYSEQSSCSWTPWPCHGHALCCRHRCWNYGCRYRTSVCSEWLEDPSV